MFFKTQLYINKIHVIINTNAMIMYISYWYISYIFISTRYLGYRVPVRDLFDNVIKLPCIYVSMINEDWTGLFEIYRRAFISIKNLVI